MYSFEFVHDLSAKILRPISTVRGVFHVIRLINKFYLFVGSSTIKQTVMRDGSKLLIDLRSNTEFYCFYSGLYDNFLISLCCRLMKNGGNFLDVGGNIGIYSIQVGRTLNNNQKCFCFEPINANAKRIRENIVINNLQERVFLFELALSNCNGPVEMVLREDFQAGSLTGNASIIIDMEPDKNFRKITAKAMRLDDCASDLGITKISVIKVDIEGHEDLFISGANNLMVLYKPIIICEINKWFFHARDVDIDRAFKSAIPTEYFLFRFGNIRGITQLVPLSEFSECHNIENIVLCPSSRVEELKVAVSHR